MATKEEIKKQIEELQGKIKILEWDKAKDQLNPGKLGYLDSLKKKVDELTIELESAPDKEAVEDVKSTEAEENVAPEEEKTENTEAETEEISQPEETKSEEEVTEEPAASEEKVVEEEKEEEKSEAEKYLEDTETVELDIKKKESEEDFKDEEF